MSYLEEPEELEHECAVCGAPIQGPGICRSKICFKVDNE